MEPQGTQTLYLMVPDSQSAPGFWKHLATLLEWPLKLSGASMFRGSILLAIGLPGGFPGGPCCQCHSLCMLVSAFCPCSLNLSHSDIFILYDGDDLSSHVLFQYLGGPGPRKLYSSTPDLTVKFHSDPAGLVFGKGHGFIMNYIGELAACLGAMESSVQNADANTNPEPSSLPPKYRAGSREWWRSTGLEYVLGM